MSVILRLGAVNTDTPYSRLISDGAEYDQPLDMTSPGPNDDDQYHSPPQTYPGCFGLPYQDHNYGAPPPPSPPRPSPPVKLSSSPLDINEEVVVTSDTPTPPPQLPLPVKHPVIQQRSPVIPQRSPVVPQRSPVPQRLPAPQHQPAPPPPQQPVPQPSPPKPQPQTQYLPPPKLRHLDEQIDDSITRCICDFIHDDGYMICCDRCSVWQHIVCMGLDRESIPDTYLCEMCDPRPVDSVTAREIQIRKREFLKTLIEHDNSETDTDPEEINNRLMADGLTPTKKQQRLKLKKRKERMNQIKQTKKRMKLLKKEKENNNRDINKRPKLMLKNFPMKTAKKEKQLNKKVTTPVIQNENAQDPWDDPPQNEALDLSFDKWDVNKDIWATSNSSWSPSLSTFNSWEDSYEVARYNHYSTYVQEYLNSIYINGHHNDIADLVTDGLRVQRCQVKELKMKRKALQATSPIPNGQPIIEVIGKVMTKQQYDKDNFGQRELSPFVFFYGPVFELDLVVDATDYGNDARFIRRSCLPNAVVRHVVAGGQAHFIAVATKEIPETSEITIPYDYDYKKWNFCVDCACLRNNCPVRRFQKRMLKFKKQLQIGSARDPKKEKKLKSPEGSPIKSPVRSPIKSPIRSPIHSPYKSPIQSPLHSPIQQSLVKTPEKMDISPVVPRTPEQEPLSPVTTPTPSPPKMIRRSQVHKQKQNLKKGRRNSIQGRRKSMSALENSTKVRSLRVPSNPVDVVSTEQEPITTPEPAAMRSSETDPLTSPELPKEPTTSVKPQEPTPVATATSTQQGTEKRKLTREERKMEAIMKAFEKMEKRQERKNSAQAHKPEQKKLVVDEQPKKTPVKEKKQHAERKKQQQQQQQEIERQQHDLEVERQEQVEIQKREMKQVEEEKVEVKAEEEVKEDVEQEEAVEMEIEDTLGVKEEESSPVKVKKEEEKSEVETKPPVEPKILSPLVKPPDPQPKPDIEPEVVAPVDEDIKVEPAEVKEEVQEEVQEEVKELKEEVKVQEEEPRPTRPVRETRGKGKKARRAAARRRTRLSTSAAVGPEVPAVSGEDSSSMPLPHPSASCPATPQAELLSPPSFKFLKTKRHLMNEWLSEKGDKPGKTDPLEVSVDEDDSMFVTCLPSPRNSMDRLRRNSQSNGGRPLTQSQSSAGSAKKRWLKQAMDEGSSDATGMVSPVPGPSSGGMSPNPLACMQSPGESSAVDFVTPLKKRRLARESVSLDSVTSESPTPTPTPSSTQQPSGSYFMVESGGDTKLDSFKMKNGFKAFFSPLRPDSIEEDSVSKCSSQAAGTADQCSSASVRDSIESDLSDSCTGEARPQGLSETEVGKVSDSEADSSVCVKTGKKLAPDQESCEISESCVRTSDSNEITRDVHSVETSQHQKSANSEPDSSDSVQCRYGDLPMEVECDSLSVNSGEKRLNEGTVSSVVDSTETEGNRRDTGVMEAAVSSQQENVATDSNCDSCVRERADSYTEDNRLSSSSLTVNSHPCTSSSSPFRHNICDSQKNSSPQKSCVDSSTDLGNQRTNLGNYSVLDSTQDAVGNSVTQTLGGSVNSDINSTNDVGATENLHTEFYLSDSSEVRNRADMFSDSGNYLLPSRYFNGLNGISAEMTVDSTTHLTNTAMGLTNNSIINSAGFSSLSSLSTYDSDSMDVTSASDACQGMYDNSMGMMEVGPGNEVEQPVPQKEKKKVSLQEYRKRVKDKPATTSTSTSVTSTTTPNTGTVTSSIKTPPKLDKIPSLPSLPMFETTQRKEFKSSSELLSPIFNRPEKQEEVTRTMSLSERLRQEFGLDDSTDDEEHKTDQTGESDPPPPPPPPPPQSQTRTSTASSTSSIPSLMSLKTKPACSLKTPGTTAISSSTSAASLGSLSGGFTKPGLSGLPSQTKVPSMPALASKILGDLGTNSSSGSGSGKPSLSSKILSDLGALLGKARSAAASMAQNQPPLGKLSVSSSVPSMIPPPPPPGKSSATTKTSALSSSLGKLNPPLINSLTGKMPTSAPTGVPPPPSKGTLSGAPPSVKPGVLGVPPPPPPGKVQASAPPNPPGKLPTGVPPPGKIPTGVAPQPGKVPTGVPPPPGKGINGGPAPSSKPTTAKPAADSAVQNKVTKLAAQLAAALKAANGQAALGGLVGGPVTSSASLATDQNGPVLSNGHGSSTGPPQVFDYGHRSGAQYKRQNSAPNNPSSAQTQFHHTNKASPPVAGQGPSKFHGFNKLSPSVGNKLSPSLGNKLSPSLGNHNGHAKNMHGQFSGTSSSSPSGGVHPGQFSSSQHQSHSSHRKHSSHKFSKQHSTGHSHKYS